MKNKKILTLTNFCLSIMLVLCVPTISATFNSNPSVISDSSSDARSENIGWKYKVENGKLYKRLYNYTNRTWIGDWILVG